ncbi:MAG: hypothetical protein Kow0069_21970 [Promethearchaeota archaeon]
MREKAFVALLFGWLVAWAASLLAFHAVLPGPTICGSPCEYWWSWLFHWSWSPGTACVALCQPRNALYRPLFLLGSALLVLALSLAVATLRASRSSP